jgi:Xaa-Pro aminopeptidase
MGRRCHELDEYGRNGANRRVFGDAAGRPSCAGGKTGVRIASGYGARQFRRRMAVERHVPRTGRPTGEAAGAIERGGDGRLSGHAERRHLLFYGIDAGRLFVHSAEGEATFYVRRSLARAQAESGVRAVALGPFRQFGQQLADDYPSVFAAGTRPVVGADLDVMPAQLYMRIAAAVPQADWADASRLLRTVRSVKSAAEIARIAAAAEAADAALMEGLQQLREGMTELEVIAVIESALRRRGHSGLLRMRGYNQETVTGVVAAGEAAAEPSCFDGPVGGRGLSPASPHGVSRRPIGRNEPILLDIGCCLDGYVIDQTRTAVIGRLPDELRRAYDVSVAILRRAETMLRPGQTPESIYAEAVRMAEEAGLAEHFMGYGRDRVKFLGHGIGLELDEWPVLAKGFDQPLEPGMVLAVEPKFTFPDRGVVGIENTYVVTETGCRALTVSPETLFELPVR